MRLLPAVLATIVVLAVALTACGRSSPEATTVAPPTQAASEPATLGGPTSIPGAATETTLSADGVATTQPLPTTQGGSTSQASGAQTVVAEVNGDAIPMADFQRQLTDTRTYLMNEGLIDPETDEGQAALRALRDQVLEQLIDQTLIMQAAEEQGLTVTDAELEASIEGIKKDLGSDEAFAQSLAANNLTKEEFRKLQRQQLLSRKLMDRITEEIPNEDEQVHARHILLESRTDAEEVLRELEEGAGFAEVAAERSIDETTAENGGDLGWFPQGVVLPEIEEVAFDLEPGELSGVVETAFGYHILEVLEREVRPIPGEIQEGLRQQRITNWLEAQRAEATIERHLDPTP